MTFFIYIHICRALFGEELGQDFFGFKDLGLDQEYNMSSLQIPSKLWFKNDESRLKKMAKGKAKGIVYHYVCRDELNTDYLIQQQRNLNYNTQHRHHLRLLKMKMRLSVC